MQSGRKQFEVGAGHARGLSHVGVHSRAWPAPTSPYGVQCINSLARGAVRERMLFNRLAEGSILLPSHQEQLRASKALVQIKSVKSAIQKQLNDLDKISERLLVQAFEKK